MLNYKNISAIIFILFLFTFKINAQGLKHLEANFNSLNKTLIKEQAKLYSLNKYLNKKVKEIDSEKEKKPNDNEKIKQLMASSVTISNDIDEQRKKVEALELEIESVKRKLNDYYSFIIDSLASLEKSSHKGITMEEIESQIAFYTEKKLNVAPKIKLLSLHPQKILKIDLNKINNASERKIYKDYLQKALEEVNDQLGDVENRMKETAKIIVLKKKTKRFLEESELESNIRPQGFSTGRTVTSESNGRTPFISTPSRAIMLSQAQSYNLLLNQLNIDQKIDANIKWNIIFDSKNPSISIEEYHKLLTLVKKRLEEYRLVLLHKLSSDE